jgi:large subunit ribosomal protein L25
MNKIDLIVKERESFGSAEGRRMRRTGWVPGVLYSEGNEAVALTVEEKALLRAVGREGGSVILNLTFEGKKKAHPAILKEYQADPLGRGMLHVDFMEVRMDQPVEAHVRLELTGQALGVRDGGIMDQSLRELQIRCLPGDIPETMHYDVEQMVIGDSIKVSDLTPPPGVEILNDAESQVASVIPPTIIKEEVTEEVEEGAEAAEAGEEKPAAEGEEAPEEG